MVLSDEQKAELLLVFNTFDTDRSGTASELSATPCAGQDHRSFAIRVSIDCTYTRV